MDQNLPANPGIRQPRPNLPRPNLPRPNIRNYLEISIQNATPQSQAQNHTRLIGYIHAPGQVPRLNQHQIHQVLGGTNRPRVTQPRPNLRNCLEISIQNPRLQPRAQNQTRLFIFGGANRRHVWIEPVTETGQGQQQLYRPNTFQQQHHHQQGTLNVSSQLGDGHQSIVIAGPRNQTAEYQLDNMPTIQIAPVQGQDNVPEET